MTASESLLSLTFLSPPRYRIRVILRQTKTGIGFQSGAETEEEQASYDQKCGAISLAVGIAFLVTTLLYYSVRCFHAAFEKIAP